MSTTAVSAATTIQSTVRSPHAIEDLDLHCFFTEYAAALPEGMPPAPPPTRSPSPPLQGGATAGAAQRRGKSTPPPSPPPEMALPALPSSDVVRDQSTRDAGEPDLDIEAYLLRLFAEFVDWEAGIMDPASVSELAAAALVDEDEAAGVLGIHH
uniref:Uncharacterized protein n=1 Tax=Mycena chlorophos TaxID=658473 RepID=A0ABQ0LZY3_MYCCL|nr:predicted protein [Mycena chlorophos]